jgi:DDE family transposase
VPVDATSLTLTDKARRKGFGAVGSWRQGSQGVHAMTALAISQEGTALGVAAQKFWVRKRRSKASKKRASPENCETRFWLDTLVETHAAFREQAPDTEAWFQLDRGADCWPVLETAIEHQMLLTVRAAHDRRVDTSAQWLWDEVEAAPIRMAFKIAVSQRVNVRKRRRINGRRIQWTITRKARVAELAVRAIEVPLHLNNGETLLYNAVLVKERHRRGDDRIEWMLLTTHPIRTRADIRAVVDGYALRWKVEEFHRTWKRGRCRVEDTQLRSKQAVLKWATILASVATRAMRLTYQARETPDAPATEELTRFELDAIIALRQPKGIKLGHEPTLGQAVRWIADLGGYVGPWNGPPGPKVIGRGLDDVLAAAKALEAAQKMR